MSIIKAILRFKLIWLLKLAIIIFGFWLVYNYSETRNVKTEAPQQQNSSSQPQAPSKVVVTAPITQESGIILQTAVICLDVDDNLPLLSKKTFSKNVDFLYCYTSFSNVQKKQKVEHRWIGEGDLDRRILNLNEGSSAVWSQKDFFSNKSSDWRVQIVDQNDRIIKEINFELK